MTIKQFIEGDAINLHLLGDMDDNTYKYKMRKLFIKLFREQCRRSSLYAKSHISFIESSSIYDNICGTQTLNMLITALPLIDMHSSKPEEMLDLVSYIVNNMECWYFG